MLLQEVMGPKIPTLAQGAQATEIEAATYGLSELERAGVKVRSKTKAVEPARA